MNQALRNGCAVISPEGGEEPPLSQRARGHRARPAARRVQCVGSGKECGVVVGEGGVR